AGEPRGSLEWPDGVRRAPRGADGQQDGGALGTRPGSGSKERLWQRVGVERPSGSDAVLAVPDALPVGSGTLGGGWRPPWKRGRIRGGARSRTWSRSCRGTSARTKNGRGDVRTRSRRRTRRSPAEPWGVAELASVIRATAQDVARVRVRASREQAGSPSAYSRVYRSFTS